jgi:hypothetical protein
MTPEKFYDYLEGKLPPAEREQLERALIHDPELQRQFVAARQVHRRLGRPPNDSDMTLAQAGSRGRQIAAACAVLVALNVAIGLYVIFHQTKPSPEVEQAKEEALRARLRSSLEKSAATLFPPPTLARPIVLTVPSDRQEVVAQQIIAAAGASGGSGTKTLPNENGVSVLVLIPASAEPEFRKLLSALGAPAPTAEATTAPSPNEPVHLEIVLAKPD